jgi:hypothetical protein
VFPADRLRSVRIQRALTVEITLRPKFMPQPRVDDLAILLQSTDNMERLIDGEFTVARNTSRKIVSEMRCCMNAEEL